MQTASAFHAILLALIGVVTTTAGTPVGWRNDGTGKFPAATPPTSWAANRNIVWRTEMPGRSLSSPVIVENRVFVTAEPAELVCVSVKDGKTLWKRSHQYANVFERAKAERIEKNLELARGLGKEVNALHRQRDAARKANDVDKQKSIDRQINTLRERIAKLTEFPPMPGGDTANTGSTPTSDGTNVFAVFGTGIVSSHTLSGKRNWMRFIEAPGSNHCASPVLIDGKLIVHLRNLIALDATTGKTIWTAKTGARSGSPVVARIDGKSVIVTPEGAVVRVADGRILATKLFQLNYASPIVHDGVIYAMQNSGIKAVRITNAKADQAVTKVLWETTGSRSSRLASPIYHDGLLYSVTEQGILEVYNAGNGSRVYRKRLLFNGGRVDPSISLAGNRLYVSNTRGATVVLQPGKTYREIARNTLKDGNSSSQAFAGSRLFIRTRKFLYCIMQSKIEP